MPKQRKPKTDNQVRAQEIRNLKRALGEERMALVAISRALLRDHPDPAKAQARMDAFVRAGVRHPRTPEQTKRALTVGRQIVAKAIALELGKPQPLWEDGTADTGNVDAVKIKRITDGDTQPEQLGLGMNGEDPLGDVEAEASERENTFARIRDTLLFELSEYGSMTEPELFVRYRKRPDAITGVSDYILHKRRRELKTRGLIKEISRNGPEEKDIVWGVAV